MTLQYVGLSFTSGRFSFHGLVSTLLLVGRSICTCDKVEAFSMDASEDFDYPD